MTVVPLHRAACDSGRCRGAYPRNRYAGTACSWQNHSRDTQDRNSQGHCGMSKIASDWTARRRRCHIPANFSMQVTGWLVDEYRHVNLHMAQRTQGRQGPVRQPLLRAQIRSQKAGRKRKRWVIYNGIVEASKVPAEWHAWLHYTAEAPLSTANEFEWQKEHLPNLTGTLLRLSSAGTCA